MRALSFEERQSRAALTPFFQNGNAGHDGLKRFHHKLKRFRILGTAETAQFRLKEQEGGPRRPLDTGKPEAAP